MREKKIIEISCKDELYKLNNASSLNSISFNCVECGKHVFIKTYETRIKDRLMSLKCRTCWTNQVSGRRSKRIMFNLDNPDDFERLEKEVKSKDIIKYICKDCGKPITVLFHIRKRINRYKFLLCRKCYTERNCLAIYGKRSRFQTDEFKKKNRKTRKEKYGDPNYNNRKKARETYRNKTGYNHPAQNPSTHGRLKYLYDDEMFDSEAELTYYIKHLNQGDNIERNATYSIDYYVGKKKHIYIPDFIVDGEIVEVKGEHLLDGKIPYKKHKNKKIKNYKEFKSIYKAKNECVNENKITIIPSKCEEIVDYKKQILLNNPSFFIFHNINLMNYWINFFRGFTPYDTIYNLKCEMLEDINGVLYVKNPIDCGKTPYDM